MIRTRRRDDGPVRAVRRLASSLVEGARLRAELFALELAEERRRVLGLVVLAALAAVALFGGLIVLDFALVLVFWEHRVPVALGLAAGQIGVGLVLAVVLLARARRLRPFEATREVLERDRERLGRRA